MSEKEYFGYQIPQSHSVFVGTEKEQITNTIRHYMDRGQEQIVMPSEDEYKSLGSIVIGCGFPMLSEDHFISAEVKDNITFDVNANAFDYIQGIANDYEGLKRGDLFKFHTGLPQVFGQFFLPEYIMQGLKEYDWSQHEDQVQDFLQQRGKVLDGLRR